MARRKLPLHAQKQDTDPSRDPSPKRKLSAHEYNNKRYEEVNKKHRSTRLYADTTNLHIDRIEGLWREVRYFLLNLLSTSIDLWL